MIQRLRTQMTDEEKVFEREIEDIIIACQRALLKIRMQLAAEMPGVKRHLVKQFEQQIEKAEKLRDWRQMARGLTKEQIARIKRRKELELKMSYEEVYGRERLYRKRIGWMNRENTNVWGRGAKAQLAKVKREGQIDFSE
mmetsp:Transcript_40700/g.70431  ORF Transcript_40700/g.70431 Transcript_40700/m.70431 type:complete len:140 (-) Transcript_40700:41-460(-)